MLFYRISSVCLALHACAPRASLASLARALRALWHVNRLGSIVTLLGAILGRLARVGIILARFGAIFARLGVILGDLGAILRDLGAILASSWAVLGHLGRILASQNPLEIAPRLLQKHCFSLVCLMFL